MKSRKIALKIDSLSFCFNPESQQFFKDLSAKFEQGKIHFICGRNGTGKSTFFRILQGNLNHDEKISGNIYLNNKLFRLKSKNCNDLKMSIKSSIKIVPQKFDQMLSDKFTFLQNLSFSLFNKYPSFLKKPKPVEKPDFLTDININYKDPVKKLSGGQRQILAIASALQKPTKILLLDEPTAAIDDENSIIVIEFLKKLIKTMDLTVIVICHDKELVKEYSEESYFELFINSTSHIREFRKIVTS